MSDDQSARLELELLHQLIARQEELRQKVRSLIVSLAAALFAAWLSDSFALDDSDFVVLLSGTSVLGWVSEAVYNMAEQRAIDRFRTVESQMRGDAPYDGPAIGISLELGVDSFAHSLIYVRIWPFYVGLIALGLLGVCAS